MGAAAASICLVDEVTVRAEVLLADADELFRLAPLRRLRLIGAEGRVKKLAALPHLAALCRLLARPTLPALGPRRTAPGVS